MIARLLAAREAAGCYLVGADSLIAPKRLRRLARAGAVVDGVNSDGFVPGEGAAALLLVPHADRATKALIAGLGTARDPGLAKGEAATGQAIGQALDQALADARIKPAQLSAAVHDLAGQYALFEELALAAARPPLSSLPALEDDPARRSPPARSAPLRVSCRWWPRRSSSTRGVRERGGRAVHLARTFAQRRRPGEGEAVTTRPGRRVFRRSFSAGYPGGLRAAADGAPAVAGDPLQLGPGTAYNVAWWQPGSKQELQIQFVVRQNRLVSLDHVMEVAPGGGALVGSDGSSRLVLFSSSGAELWHHDGRVSAFRFSPSGADLAVATDKAIEIFRLAEQRMRILVELPGVNGCGGSTVGFCRWLARTSHRRRVPI